jgi:glycerate kinase
MTEGAGAAGGVGYAFVALMGCALKRGINLFLEMVKFRDVVADAGLVVTGEGCVDSQTLMGKAPSGVLRYAEAAGVPCVAVGGKVVMSETLEHSGFCAIYESKPSEMSLSDAMHPIQAYQNLRDVGQKVAHNYK